MERTNKKQVNRDEMWNRAHSEFPTNLDHDKRLRQLEAELLACSMGRRRGCFDCPCQSECNILWDKASEKSSVRYLLFSELEDFRRQFAGISMMTGRTK